jgi:hypothetical protein
VGLDVLLFIREGRRILRLGVVGGRGGSRGADTDSGVEFEVELEVFGGVTIARFFSFPVESAVSLRDRLPLAAVVGFVGGAVSTLSSSLILRLRPRFSFPAFSSALAVSSVVLSERRLCRRRGVALMLVRQAVLVGSALRRT